MSIVSRLGNFLITNSEVMCEYDMSNYVSNALWKANQSLTSTLESFKLDRYISLIEKTQKEINALDVAATDTGVAALLNSAIDIDSLDISVRDIIIKDEVEKIQPQYLTQFVNNIAKSIENLYKDDLSKADIDRYTSPETILKVKKQCVATSLPYDIDPKTLKKIADPIDSHVRLTKQYIEYKYLAFLNNRVSILKSLNTTVSSVRDTLINVNSTLKTYLSILEETKERMVDNDDTGKSSELKLEISKLNYLAYNAIRAASSIAAYITFVTLHKMERYSSNVVSANKVYCTLTTLTNMDVKNKFESVEYALNIDTDSIVEEFVDGNYEQILSLSNDIITTHAMNMFESVLGDDVDPDDASGKMRGIASKYNYGPNEIYAMITNRIGGMQNDVADVVSASNNDLVSLNDYIDQRQPEDTTNDKEINTPDPVCTSKGEYCRLISELDTMESNLKPIMKAADDFKNYMVEQYNLASNYICKSDEYDVSENKKSLLSYLESSADIYDEFIENVGSTLVKRLMLIDESLNCLESPRDGDVLTEAENYAKVLNANNDDTDYLEYAYDSIFDLMNESTDNLFESCMAAVDNYQRFQVSGKVMMEADKNDANQNNNQDKDANEKNPSSTTPTVTDKNNKSKKEETNTSTNPADDNKPATPEEKKSLSKIFAEKLSSLKKSIASFFNRIFNKYKEVNNRQKATNAAWLNEERRKYLSERNYNGVSVQVLQYSAMPAETILTRISSFATNLGRLDFQNASKIKNKWQLYKTLFNSVIPYVRKWDDDMDIAAIITKYFKVDGKELNMTTISDNALKQYVNTAIVPFCSNYYDTYAPRIENELKKLQNSVVELSQKLANAGSGTPNKPDSTVDNKNDNGPTTESVMTYGGLSDYMYESFYNILMEANQQSTGNVADWLTSTVEIFGASVLNAIRDRVNDYFKILGGLCENMPASNQNNNNNNQNNNNNKQDNTSGLQA